MKTLLRDLSAVVRAGRLVSLLKGDGLNRDTVEELLRPESRVALRSILFDRLFQEDETPIDPSTPAEDPPALRDRDVDQRRTFRRILRSVR